MKNLVQNAKKRLKTILVSDISRGQLEKSFCDWLLDQGCLLLEFTVNEGRNAQATFAIYGESKEETITV